MRNLFSVSKSRTSEVRLCVRCSGNVSAEDRFCVSCGHEVSAVPSTRYHGLDALRGIAMLIGIVLHSALPYIPNIEAFWPADKGSSQAMNTVFQFIHIWRMPLFFILSGFFAHLIINRGSWKNWWGNRFLRIGIPIVVFFPLMSLTIPWIFQYGKTGQLIFFYSDEGQPFHMWFLWQLMIFVVLTALFRFPYLMVVAILNGLNKIGISFTGNIFRKCKYGLSGILLRSRFPLAFIILGSLINLPTQGELIANPIASGLYFVIGYSIYKNASLFEFLKDHWRYYLIVGVLGFILLMILDSKDLVTDIYSRDLDGDEYLKAITEPFAAIKVFIEITCAMMFSYAFIGLSENKFGSYDPKLRFVSDGAYWMYLIHLPIVTFLTFLMFGWTVSVWYKFSLAIVATLAICFLTYRYMVRPTIIGILLNGKRHPWKFP